MLWREPAKTYIPVPWSRLYEQYGCDYDRVQSFTYEARRQLREIMTHWPGLKIEILRGRLVLFTCPPSVSRA